MTIHTDDPFATPEPERSAARQFRGRLAAPVTLWTSGATPGATPLQTVRPAGLTVASVVVADGAPAHLIALVDPESELYAALEQSGGAVVTVLTESDRHLADVFGFVAPAPGGPFATTPWVATEWGPRLASERAWSGVRLLDARDVGYSMLVDVAIEHVQLGPASAAPLVLNRGRYLGVASR